MTEAPEARAASVEPAGIATGKFHGGVTTMSFDGMYFAPSTESSSSASCA